MAEQNAMIPRDTLLIPFDKAQEIGICAKAPEFKHINGQTIGMFVFGDLFQHGSDAYIAAGTYDRYVIAGQVQLKPWMDTPRKMEREKRVIHIGEEPKHGIRISTRCAQCGKDVLRDAKST